MARSETPDQIKSKRKALSALFPYAVLWEQGGDNRRVDAFLAIVRLSKFMVQPIARLLDKAGPSLLNWVMTFMSPYTDWEYVSDTNTVTRWAHWGQRGSYLAGKFRVF